MERVNMTKPILLAAVLAFAPTAMASTTCNFASTDADMTIVSGIQQLNLISWNSEATSVQAEIKEIGGKGAILKIDGVVQSARADDINFSFDMRDGSMLLIRIYLMPSEEKNKGSSSFQVISNIATLAPNTKTPEVLSADAPRLVPCTKSSLQ